MHTVYSPNTPEYQASLVLPSLIELLRLVDLLSLNLSC